MVRTNRAGRTAVMRTWLWVCVALLAPAVLWAQITPEEQARRLLEDGRAARMQGKVKQALDNFNTIVTGFPSTQWVDDALLEMGRYYVEVEGNVEKGRLAFEQVAQRFPQSDGAPGAYYYLGWLTMNRALSMAELDDAQAQFARIQRLYPKSEWVPKALYASGLVDRRASRFAEAADVQRRVFLEYPTHEAAPEAQFQVGDCLTLMGEFRLAMEEYQRLRNRFPQHELSTRALDRITALYRLYGTGTPALTLDSTYSAGVGEVFKSLKAILWVPPHTLWLGSDKLNAVIPAVNGKTSLGLTAQDLSSLSLSSGGELIVAAATFVRIGPKDVRGFSIPNPKTGLQEPLTHIEAAVMPSDGGLLVADSKQKAVYRYNARFEYRAPFPDSNPREIIRLARDLEGGIAMLDGTTRAINVFDEQGRPLRTISGRFPGRRNIQRIDMRDTRSRRFCATSERPEPEVAVLNADSRSVLMNCGRRCGLLAMGFLLAGAMAFAQAQGANTGEMQTSAQRELQAVQDMLARAQAEFDGPQQSRSIVQFEQIAERLESLRQKGDLPVRGREILAQAYEYQGRAYFNIGLQEKAAQSFRSLIQVHPQHALSKDKVSPKVVDFFNSVKKALIGYLAVSSKPAGARVSLNGEFLALTDFFPLEVLAGEYAIEIARDGYKSETRSVSIAPRATETIDIALTRTAASCFFITQPIGVEIWVDGELRATTGGSLSPDLHETVRAKGLDPARASARMEIPNLTLGAHVIEFRKRCFETVRTSVNVPEAQDYDTEPIKLEDSLAALQLTSDPPGARILLDGEPRGVTPVGLEGICSGPHRLEVKHASGKYIQEFNLERNEALAIDCPIRPTLAFLGIVAESAGAERMVSEVEERIVQNFSKIGTLNFLRTSREHVDRILESEKLTRRALLPNSGTDPDLIRKATEKLAAALEAQGFLLAVLPEERLQRTVTLHLLAAGNTVTDPKELAFSETAAYMSFIATADRKFSLFRPWSGLITVDTLSHEGVPVLRVLAGSPAQQAEIRAGEIITSVDGKLVTKTTDLLTAIEGKKAKDSLALHVKGASGTRAVDLTLAETPQEIPLNDPAVLYNKVMMDLRQQVEGYPGTEAAAFARLNLALCAMHFSDYVAAHEHLLKAKSELPQRPGISQGTALYYLGVTLERLGYRSDAIESYRAAAAFTDATLFNNDGPAVAPLAMRRASGN
ncbi:MAG: PEGA domain-containing protein [Vicinamibacteria bacterium]|nr:PEGA domain-containing protein [Vicinamibacteria bacterium]